MNIVLNARFELQPLFTSTNLVEIQIL